MSTVKPQRPLRIAIFGSAYSSSKSPSAARVLNYLYAHGVDILLDASYHRILCQQLDEVPPYSSLIHDEQFEADYAISLGGDGTFLRTASKVGIKQIPIMGINMGRLGFLADVLPAEIEEALKALLQGQLLTESHTVIEVQVEGDQLKGCPFALNDVALLKRDTASMITLRCSVNGRWLVTYEADGLIVSTPTGSTAYGLSVGGPIIVPQANIFCLTPVAPHSLNMRPIALPDSAEIVIEVESRSHCFLTAVDGRSEPLSEGARVTIRKAAHQVLTVRQPHQHYFSTLREKLMWGADKRQDRP